jgi:hypothetical protein
MDSRSREAVAASQARAAAALVRAAPRARDAKGSVRRIALRRWGCVAARAEGSRVWAGEASGRASPTALALLLCGPGGASADDDGPVVDWVAELDDDGYRWPADAAAAAAAVDAGDGDGDDDEDEDVPSDVANATAAERPGKAGTGLSTRSGRRLGVRDILAGRTMAASLVGRRQKEPHTTPLDARKVTRHSVSLMRDGVCRRGAGEFRANRRTDGRTNERMFTPLVNATQPTDEARQCFWSVWPSGR